MAKTKFSLLHDMLDSSQRVIEYTTNKTEKDFLNDIILQDAVCRRLAIIGEAAYELISKIAPSLLDEEPDIPWRKVANLRHFLVHHYNDVQMDRVWKTAINDLPPLVTQLSNIMDRS